MTLGDRDITSWESIAQKLGFHGMITLPVLILTGSSWYH